MRVLYPPCGVVESHMQCHKHIHIEGLLLAGFLHNFAKLDTSLYLARVLHKACY